MAREVEIALPHELNAQQREALVVTFAREAFINKGMIVDVSIHPPSPEGDSRNFHAHLLITMRRIGLESFGPKAREWNRKLQLVEWRRQWAQAVNHCLGRNGRLGRVDHRSFKERGIDREPTIHLGPVASYCQRHGVKTRRGDKVQQIRKLNKLVEQMKAIAKKHLMANSQRKQDDKNNTNSEGRSSEGEFWVTRLKEHKRNVALAYIRQALQMNKDFSDDDFRNLTFDDLERIHTKGVEFMKTLINDLEQYRDRGRGR